MLFEDRDAESGSCELPGGVEAAGAAANDSEIVHRFVQ
jgi:hypothetical protein